MAASLTPPVAVIGLGRMGTGIGQSLLRKRRELGTRSTGGPS